MRITEIKFCALDSMEFYGSLLICFFNVHVQELMWRWHLDCFVCLSSVDFFSLLNSRLSCQMGILALVGITKTSGVCFDCSISVFYSVCIYPKCFNVIKPLSFKDLWVLGETQTFQCPISLQSKCVSIWEPLTGAAAPQFKACLGSGG